MENKINIAELLKGCPKGMELDCTMFEDVKFISVEEGDKPICIRTDDIYRYLTKFGTWTFDDNAKCVIFPKGKTTWNGFQRPFEDGDIVVTPSGNIAIISNKTNNKWYHAYCGLFARGTYIDCDTNVCPERHATEKEKQKLFDAIKAKGFKWNPETKTLEKSVKPKFKVGDITKDKIGYKVKIIEVCEDKEYFIYESLRGIGRFSFSDQDDYELVSNKFDITTLKPFDKVLVRNTNKSLWWGQFYMAYNENEEYSFDCTYDCWRQCIPFKNNEHLLGTANDCDEFYKTWE